MARRIYSRIRRKREREFFPPTPEKVSALEPRPFVTPVQREVQSSVPEEQPKQGVNLLELPHLLDSPPPIQAKLTLGKPGDKSEREADTVARQVVAEIHSPPESAAKEELQTQFEMNSIQREELKEEGDRALQMQRQEAVGGEDATTHLESEINQTKGSGSPLEPQLRERIEGTLGGDLSAVTIHTDATSDRLNRSLQSRAFTTGRDIYFKQGEYDPNTKKGQELIAHESAHVLQQNPEAGVIQRKLIPESQRAFDTAIAQRPDFKDLKQATDDYMPTSDQKQVTDIRSSLDRESVKGSPGGKLKDFVRAFLLAEYADRLDTLEQDTSRSQKEKDKKRKVYLSKALEVRDKHKPLLEKGVAAPETQAFLRHYGFEKGIDVSPEAKQKAAKGPRIDVRSTFIGGKILGISLRAHLFIVYTSSDGTQYYFRGGPDENNNTVADMGEYTPGTIDWDPSAPSTTVLKGEEAAKKFDGLIEATSKIDAMKVPYISFAAFENKKLKNLSKGENCNATAWTILKRAGVPPDKPNGVHPGWGYILGQYSGEGEKIEPEEDNTQTGEGDRLVGEGEIQVYRDRWLKEPLTKLPKETDIETVLESEEGYKIRFGEGEIGFVRRQDLRSTATLLEQYLDRYKPEDLQWVLKGEHEGAKHIIEVAKHLKLPPEFVAEAMYQRQSNTQQLQRLVENADPNKLAEMVKEGVESKAIANIAKAFNLKPQFVYNYIQAENTKNAKGRPFKVAGKEGSLVVVYRSPSNRADQEYLDAGDVVEVLDPDFTTGSRAADLIKIRCSTKFLKGEFYISGKDLIEVKTEAEPVEKEDEISEVSEIEESAEQPPTLEEFLSQFDVKQLQQAMEDTSYLQELADYFQLDPAILYGQLASKYGELGGELDREEEAEETPENLEEQAEFSTLDEFLALYDVDGLYDLLADEVNYPYLKEVAQYLSLDNLVVFDAIAKKYQELGGDRLEF